MSEDSIGLENPPKTPGNISWRQNAEKNSDTHTRPSFKQKLLRILGIGGVVASTAVGVEATGVRNTIGETTGNVANNLLLNDDQRAAIEEGNIHPDKRKTVVVTSDAGEVNLRSRPNSLSDIKGKVKDGTVLENTIEVLGNDPQHPDNPKFQSPWRYDPESKNFIHGKYTEVSPPNPLNPNNQNK